MAEVYNTDRFAVLFPESQNPPVENLGLAGRFLRQLLSAYNIPVAFVGGWAIFLRGSGRSTNDFDVTVCCAMPYLMDVLRAQPRLCVPQTHGATSVQIFVQTGGSFDPNYQFQLVSVDIIISGNLGTPVNLFTGTEEIFPVETTQGREAVSVIDLYHQLSAKLFAFVNRQSRNDFTDIEFLLQDNYEAVWDIQEYLNYQHRKFYFDSYAAGYSGSPDLVEWMRTLLGVEG